MMSPPRFLISLIFLSIRCNGELQTDICNVPKGSCGPFIPQLPRSYVAKMEVTDPLANTTRYATEYYDGENLRGAITWRLQGRETRFIYDGFARTLITVEGWTPTDPYETSARCFVSQFTYSEDNLIIGVEANMSTVYLALIGGLLRYNPDLRFKYNNGSESYVRGMKADRWEACLYVPKVDGTFDVVFYWSDLLSNIPTPSGEPSVPLKTVVSGRFRPNPDVEVYENVYIVTNFIWFQSNPPINEELFQPPRGVFCQNDNKYKPFPTFPKTFSVFVETQLQVDGNPNVTLKNQKLWYNFPAKLQRVDEYNSNSDLATITDYISGVAYFVDELSTNCTISEQIYTDITKAEDIFLMNGIDDLEYLGKYTIRDRLCDTWSGKIGNVVLEWSFLDDTWHQSDVDGVLTQTPVQTILINHKPIGAEKITKNYFHFHPNEDEFAFEVDFCFPPEKRKVFQISFPLTATEVPSFDFKSFARKCRVVLAREIQVTLLRISQVQTEFNEERIYVQFTLLDKTTPSTADNVDMSVAVSNLENIMISNSLMVDGGRRPNRPEASYLTALPDSLVELDNVDPCSQNEPTSGKRAKRSTPDSINQPQDYFDMWSTGQLVGLGFGLFAIGSILGVIAMLILLLRLQPKINTNNVDDGIQLTPTTSTQE